MQLLYRGTQYTYHLPTLEVTEAEIRGNYRGVGNCCLGPCLGACLGPCLEQSLGHRLPLLPPAHTDRRHPLRYSLRATPARPVILAASQLNNWTRRHNDCLHQHLDRRLQVAQERGDQRLIDLLEAERQQLLWAFG